MFKLIGMLIGAGSVLFLVMAWFNPPQAKRTATQVNEELLEVVDKVAASQKQLTQKPAAVAASLLDEKQTSADTSPSPDVNYTPLSTEQNGESLESAVYENLQSIYAKPNWYVFWKPFNNESSAQGFAARLSRQTQRKFMVMADATGVYRIALAYADEHDKQLAIATIEETTGLRISGAGQ